MTTLTLITDVSGSAAVLVLLTIAGRLALGRGGCCDGGINIVSVRLFCAGLLMILVASTAAILSVVAA